MRREMYLSIMMDRGSQVRFGLSFVVRCKPRLLCALPLYCRGGNFAVPVIADGPLFLGDFDIDSTVVARCVECFWSPEREMTSPYCVSRCRSVAKQSFENAGSSRPCLSCLFFLRYFISDPGNCGMKVEVLIPRFPNMLLSAVEVALVTFGRGEVTVLADLCFSVGSCTPCFSCLGSSTRAPACSWCRPLALASPSIP